MAKTRSPNYPAISLAEAIDKVKKIYKVEHLHSASDEVIAKALNYVSLNGRSMGVISAIKKYGLLVPEGEGFRVSDDAVDIIETPPDSPDHIRAIEKAAFTPQLFAELHETYGSQLPSDSNLRHFLIKKKFNPNAADEVIKLYRDTLGLVTRLSPEYNASEADKLDNEKDAKHAREPQMQQPPPPFRGQPSSEVRQVLNPLRDGRYPEPLAEDERRQREFLSKHMAGGPPSEGLNFQVSENAINVTFSGTVTQEIIRKLIKHLEINIEDFPKKADLERQRQANLIKNYTTDPETGKPYTDVLSPEGRANLVNRTLELGKPPEDE